MGHILIWLTMYGTIKYRENRDSPENILKREQENRRRQQALDNYDDVDGLAVFGWLMVLILAQPTLIILKWCLVTVYEYFIWGL